MFACFLSLVGRMFPCFVGSGWLLLGGGSLVVFGRLLVAVGCCLGQWLVVVG